MINIYLPDRNMISLEKNYLSVRESANDGALNSDLPPTA